MRLVECVAQEEVSQRPDKVHLAYHPFGGVAIIAVTHQPVQGKKPFFTIAELLTPNSGGEPLKLMKVRTPGHRVINLAIVTSCSKEDVYITVQCAHRCPGGVEQVKTYLYKRVSDDDDCDANGIPSVVYQRIPRAMKQIDHGSWTASASLEGWDKIHREEPTPCIVAATNSERSPALHVISIKRNELYVDASVELDALSFPISDVIAIPGCSRRFLCVSHNSVVEVDAAALSGEETRHRCWQCSPVVSITAGAMRDNLLICGTSNGGVVLYDYRDPAIPGSSCLTETSNAPITGLFAPDAATVVTCSLGGDLIVWSQEETNVRSSAIVGGHFPLTPTVVEEPTGEGWVGMAGNGNLLAVVGEFGTLKVFLRV